MKTALYLLLLALFLFFPSRSISAARLALTTWGLDVVPSLFPYMVLCQTLAARLNQTSSAPLSVVMLLGFLGGSPSGAAALSACAQKNTITPRHLFLLAAGTGTMSPMFFLGTVSQWAHSEGFGRMLLAAHVLGALMSLLVVWLFLCRKGISLPSHPVQMLHSEQSPIARSVDAVLNVGGCIVFYSVAAAAVTHLLPGLGEGFASSIHAILESAGGLHAILNLQIDVPAKALLCAGASGFSGLSILTQNHLFLRPYGITMRHLLCFAALRCVCSSAAMLLLLQASSILS